MSVSIRPLSTDDLPDVVRIDASHTGRPNPGYWRGKLSSYLGDGGPAGSVGLAAVVDGRLAGYLLGEVRDFEFGSEPCGWIFAIGVDTADQRAGLGARLLREARRLFATADVRTVRTMVRRDDVPLLSFFRASGFALGPFVQMETDLMEREP